MSVGRSAGCLSTLCMAGIILLFSVTDDISCSLLVPWGLHQMYWIKSTKSNLQTKPIKPNIPNQTFKTKPTKPYQQNKFYQTKPTKPNQNDQRNKSKAPKLNSWAKLANPNVIQSQTSFSLPWAWHSSAPACFIYNCIKAFLCFILSSTKWGINVNVTRSIISCSVEPFQVFSSVRQFIH